MSSVTLNYRLRIRNAADSGDALVLTSVRGGTNPYIAEQPSGDGQEVDPLLGSVRTGVYTIRILDPITSGTSRVFTSQLFDAAGRQLLLSRRSYIEISTNGGSSWSLLVAGYLLNYNLTDAITWEIQIGDTRRVEQTKIVFDGTSTSFAKRGCIFGGPIAGGSWGPINDRGGFAFKVKAIYQGAPYNIGGGGAVIQYTLVNGYRGISDPLSSNLQNVLGVSKDGVDDGFVNQATNNFYSPSVAPYGWPGYGTQDALGNPITGLTAQVREFVGGPTRGFFTPGAIFNNVPGVVSGITYLVGGQFSLLWPSTISLPSVGDVHHISMFTTTTSEQCPVYLDMHPVDIVTQLWTDAGIPFDATSAANTKALLGATLRVAMRVTSSTTLLDFLEKSIFGPFGISARVGLVTGVLELFTTRLKLTATPTTTIGTNDLQDASGNIFGNDEQTIVSSVRFKSETYWAYAPNTAPANTATQPLDSVMVAKSEVAIVNADANALVTNEIVYEFQGMIHDVSGVNTDMVAMTTSVAVEMFDRFGRGAPVTDAIAILRASDTGFQIGDEVYLEPAHFPNLNKRFGDDPSVGARIMQVLRRTESPAGPIVKLIDAGSNQQPVTPAAVITIAASTAAPRISALFTITNAAAINATAALITAVQWATGSSSPANGVQFARYAAGTTPTTAVQLPAVNPGSQVWVRARTEQDGRRPSAWTAWVSVTLTGIGVPTILAVTGLYTRTIVVVWNAVNTTDLMDVFVSKNATQASSTLVAGQHYIIDVAGTTNWVALGAASNTAGLDFVASGAGAGTGTAQLVPATWDAYYTQTVGPNLIGGAGGVPTIFNSALVDVPLPGGLGTYYGIALQERDPNTGVRGPVVFSVGQTAAATTTAAAPAVHPINAVSNANGSLLTGVTLALYRTDTLDITIQRAPDSSGSPGTWADLATVRGSTETYVDNRPAGTVSWYRVTHDGPSNTRNFSQPISASAQSVPSLTQPPAQPVGINAKALFGMVGDGVNGLDEGRAAAAAAYAASLESFVDFGSQIIALSTPIRLGQAGFKFDKVGYQPSAGDPGFTYTGAGGATAAGAFVVGIAYCIATVGSTNFTAIGSASNTVGQSFVATGIGSGSGTAIPFLVTISGAPDTCIGTVDGNSKVIGGIFFDNVQRVKTSAVRALNCLGPGVHFSSTYDSVFSSTSTEGCGGATAYAFDVQTGAAGPSNQSHWLYVQSEKSNKQSIRFDPNTLLCVVDAIHSEQATPDVSYVTWYLGGNIQFNAARFNSNAPVGNASLHIEAGNMTCVHFRVEGAIVVEASAFGFTNLTLINPDIGGSFHLKTNQTGLVTVHGGKIATLASAFIRDPSGPQLIFSAYGAQIPTLTIGDCMNPPVPNLAQFFACSIGVLSSSSANSAAVFTNCEIVSQSGGAWYFVGPSGGSTAWSSITGTPTTLAGYGITDSAVYSAGTWTPSLQFGGAAVGMTYSAQSGTYTKIGKICIAQLDITLSAKGSSTGSATITGLPFTVGSISAAAFLAFYQNLTGMSARSMVARADAGSTSILLEWNTADAAPGDLQNTAFSNTTRLIMTIPFVTT